MSLLPVFFAFMILSVSAHAKRELQFQAYQPPLPNCNRSDAKKSVTLMGGYDATVELTNLSDQAQSGTIEVLNASSNTRVVFVEAVAGGYRNHDPNYVAYQCTGTDNKYSSAVGALPRWPSGSKFTVDAKSSKALTIGVIFYKVVQANDNITNFNGKFIPTIKITVDQDTGALSGYVVAMNRAFSTSAYSICAGASVIPTTPEADNCWSYSAGVPRELNGGRPF